jgi:hypothetical protein
MRTCVPRLTVVAVAAVLGSLGLGGVAHAQHWPDEPVTFAGGRVLLAGDASATFGSEDPGWFTYTDYETSALRRVRAGLTVEARPSRRLSFLAEIRAQTSAGVVPYAWYVRVSPFGNGVLDIQAGRIPPVFGAYARRSYPQDNPLIGDPLGYQYLTSARPDAVPANADQLLKMRGRGWLVKYPVGSSVAEPGVPLVAAERWDTGVEVRVGKPRLEGVVACTVGTLSYPLVRDDNHGKQLAGRVVWRPVPAFSIGASAAHGAFVSHDVLASRPDIPGGGYDQRAFGLDGEASWGRWLLRGELVANSWKLPPLDQPLITDPLGAVTGYLEAKIRMGPRLYVAARGGQLRFSTIQGTAGAATWDANVSRVEFGVGYTIRRGLLVKASVMNNWRDGGLVRRSPLASVQALFWF